MGHTSYLLGCTSRENAERRTRVLFGTDEDEVAAGPHPWPELAAGFRIPLFWIAAFGGGDVVWTERVYQDDEEDQERRHPFRYVFLWSPTSAAVARLKRRRAAVLALVGAPFGEFYDQWVTYLEEFYPEAVLLQAEDVLGLEDKERGGQMLAEAVRSLEEAEATGVLAAAPRQALNIAEIATAPRHDSSLCTPQAFAQERRFILGGSSTAEPDWPPAPSPAEIEAAAEILAAPVKPWWKFWA